MLDSQSGALSVAQQHPRLHPAAQGGLAKLGGDERSMPVPWWQILGVWFCYVPYNLATSLVRERWPDPEAT